MELLFKISDTAKTISETNFQQHYPRVNKNMDINAFKVELRKVTRDIIVPSLTKEFYNDLATKYQEDATMTENEKYVLELLQDTIAEYTVWRLSPSFNVTIGDLGIQENHGSQGQAPAAAQWRYKNFHWNVMKQADQHLDATLTYLDQNAADFETFSANQAKLRIDSFLVRNTDDFQQFINISSSRRTFRKLIPSMLKANIRYILPILGKPFYNQLLEQLKTGTLTDANKEVLQIVQAIICHYALFHAIPHLAVMIEEDGIFVLSSTDGMNTKNLAHEARIQDLKETENQDAVSAVIQLKNFLYAHVEDFPLWKESGNYEEYGVTTGLPLDMKGGAFLG